MPPLSKRKVCVVGSGNWGSAIAKIIGSNTPNLENFEDTVTMYVYDEMVNGEKLTEIINTRHENVKYLPGVRLPPNVYAEPDLVTAASGADFLVFVIPHQFIKTICATLKGQIKPTAIGISLIKGFDCAEGGGIDLISHVIHRSLRIQVAVLMGANIANEVAQEQFCETTIGCKDKRIGPMLKNLFQTENFRVVVVEDSDTVEVCGALKNVVACAAGFADGLDLGDNTKAAIIRLGLMEMIKFVDEFYPGSQLQTFFESCGLADLVTTCYGGRNRRCAEAFVKSHKGRSVAELEQDLLNGQKLQGPLAAEEVCFMLKKKGQLVNFPLFAAVHKIFQREMEAKDMIEMLKVHPVHLANEIPPEDS